MPEENKWDIIAQRFNTHMELDKIHPDAAVNIYVGWPTFFDQIKYQCEAIDEKYCNILEFCCGSGDFCEKLHALGHHVVGVDASREMLNISKKNTSKDIEYIYGDLIKNKDLLRNYQGKMDIITSIHGFDWIENIEEIINILSGLTKKDALFIFCVFSKEHVKNSLEIHDLFEDFDSEYDPKKGVCNFDGTKIPVFVRDSNYYESIFKKLGYEKVIEYYPPYPSSFFKKYLWKGSKFPEMLILSFRKTDTKLS